MGGGVREGDSDGEGDGEVDASSGKMLGVSILSNNN